MDSVDKSIERELDSIEQKIEWSIVLKDSSITHVLMNSRILEERPNFLQWTHRQIQSIPRRFGFRHTSIKLNREEASLTISWDDDGVFFPNEQILENKLYARRIQERWN